VLVTKEPALDPPPLFVPILTADKLIAALKFELFKTLLRKLSLLSTPPLAVL
jgi:hypothetical protein